MFIECWIEIPLRFGICLLCSGLSCHWYGIFAGYLLIFLSISTQFFSLALTFKIILISVLYAVPDEPNFQSWLHLAMAGIHCINKTTNSISYYALDHICWKQERNSKCYLNELFASQIMSDFIYLSNFDYSSNERTNPYSPI